MNRIEDIRHRAVSNPGEASSIDIMYLLYKLEKVDTWLTDIVHIGKSDPEYALKIAEANLNKLRE